MTRKLHIVSTRCLDSFNFQKLNEKEFTFSSVDFIRKKVDIPVNISKLSFHKDIVITSKMGVISFLQIARMKGIDLQKCSIYCLSHGTRKYAKNSGLKIVKTASNASNLAEEILNDPDVKAVTYICSNKRRNELSERLIKAEVIVQEVIAYRTDLTPVGIEQPYDAILFFSPSAVESFLKLNPLKPAACFCLGETTADYALKHGYVDIHIPPIPTEESLLETVVNHFSIYPTHAK
jgi:uroporphyrinogen-III synthase